MIVKNLKKVTSPKKTTVKVMCYTNTIVRPNLLCYNSVCVKMFFFVLQSDRISFAIEFHVHVIFSVSLLFLILEAIRNCIKISNGF